MASHRFAVRIYYEDTDFSGNVYHAAYLKFLERGRTEFLRGEGIHHSELVQGGVAFAVRSMEIFFDGAARIDDLLTIETDVISIGGARLALRQRILRGDEVLTRASLVVAAIKTSGGATRLPRMLVDRLKASSEGGLQQG